MSLDNQITSLNASNDDSYALTKVEEKLVSGYANMATEMYLGMAVSQNPEVSKEELEKSAVGMYGFVGSMIAGTYKMPISELEKAANDGNVSAQDKKGLELMLEMSKFNQGHLALLKDNFSAEDRYNAIKDTTSSQQYESLVKNLLEASNETLSQYQGVKDLSSLNEVDMMNIQGATALLSYGLALAAEFEAVYGKSIDSSIVQIGNADSTGKASNDDKYALAA